jgi:hypothetical protein
MVVAGSWGVYVECARVCGLGEGSWVTLRISCGLVEGLVRGLLRTLGLLVDWPHLILCAALTHSPRPPLHRETYITVPMHLWFHEVTIKKSSDVRYVTLLKSLCLLGLVGK